MRYSSQVRSISHLKAHAALLKILALGAKDIEAGRLRPIRDVIDRLHEESAEPDAP